MMRQLIERIRRTPLAGPLADVVAFGAAPRRALQLLGDVRATAADAEFVRRFPRPTSNAPRLLILSMTNFSYNAKVEGMLALAMRRRGWQVQVVTSSLYTNAKRIFRAYGVTDFIDFEKLISETDVVSAGVAELNRRKNDPTDFQSVLEWTYRDAWIGPQLLSSISRRQFDGAPDPRDPAVREQLFNQLLQSVKFVCAAEQTFAQRKPDLIIVNEPNYHVLGPFVDVAIAQRIPTIHFIQPSRDDGLVLKKLTRETRRIHPNSITKQTLESLVSSPWGETQEAELDDEFQRRYGGVWKIQARNQPGTIDMSKSQILDELKLDASKPIAVLFSHVLWDANLFYGRDIFENYGHWFIETVKAAVANPRLNWIIKLHPANIWKRKLSGVTAEYGEMRLIREQIGELPAHVRVLEADTRISTLSLFKAINVGITVRGSIGYELPCFGIPVVTAGTGRYSGFGFTEDHDSRESYLATLCHLEDLGGIDEIRTHRARVHAHALFVRRPWIFSSFETHIGGDVADPLYQNLTLKAGSNAEIGKIGDLDRFADWATAADDLDYLAPSR
ncbi:MULTISPECIES: hypothetical protein [Bradyrhizobium]|uniref:hypothetical protein n=1 Tax=Bradyrhizobium TaxID=374 RepID=UPI0004B0A8A2|nr:MULTISPECIES: hypothetical protein [Bradyrhizobium]BBO04178.1 hypothetical protein SG09_35280 [Bradyrhizobium ottawaense]GMO46100.1 hypothetical protein BwSF21_62140 [Bradyrhizobium ottawaense]